jgi:hypothetical protein
MVVLVVLVVVVLDFLASKWIAHRLLIGTATTFRPAAESLLVPLAPSIVMPCPNLPCPALHATRGARLSMGTRHGNGGIGTQAL